MKLKKLSQKCWNNAGNASWNLKYYAKNVETSGLFTPDPKIQVVVLEFQQYIICAFFYCCMFTKCRKYFKKFDPIYSVDFVYEFSNCFWLNMTFDIGHNGNPK